MKDLIESICFELSLNDDISNFDYENTRSVEVFIKNIEDNYTLDGDVKGILASLKERLAENKAKTSTLGKDVIKKVYLMLKNRELHPKGYFDKGGRFYLDDSELVSVRTPSAKYPYSQMKAGRTSKFVKAIADKYACETEEQLISRFKKA